MKNIQNTLIDIAEFIIIGLGVFSLVFLLIAQPLKVTGDSMYPEFTDGENLLAEKLSMNFEKPKRGDVVIIKLPNYGGALLIKRVVGLPEEGLEIKNGNIYINNIKLLEPYLKNQNDKVAGYGKIIDNQKILIPRDSYIVLGDNRKNSTDSREWGPITTEMIIGKSFLVYYPFSNIRFTF